MLETRPPLRSRSGNVRAGIRRSRVAKREANNLLRERLRRHDGSAYRIPFFCECEQSCLAAVWLEGQVFEEASEDPGWVALAAGHAPDRQRTPGLVSTRALGRAC